VYRDANGKFVSWRPALGGCQGTGLLLLLLLLLLPDDIVDMMRLLRCGCNAVLLQNDASTMLSCQHGHQPPLPCSITSSTNAAPSHTP
jgi:hypothetical protein